MSNLKAKVICAGNCPICNKPLKDGECIFMCNECKIKNEKLMELEKIKTRIDEEVVYVNKWQVKNDSIKIIDERISELKGENK